MCGCFFFQAEDGIRDLVRSRGLGDVYKRQESELRDLTLKKDDLLFVRSNGSPELVGCCAVFKLSLIHI